MDPERSESPTRILIVSADPLKRAGLVSLLESLSAVDLAPPTEPTAHVLSKVREEKPDIVLWDLGWQADESIEAISQISDEVPPIVALALNGSQAAGAREAGATSVLPRSASAEA